MGRTGFVAYGYNVALLDQGVAGSYNSAQRAQ